MTTVEKIAAPTRRLIEAWYDHSHALAILLGLFVVAWTAVQVISFAPIDLHPDVVEMFAWGRHPAAGYSKHPPLGAWMSAAWFAIFPAANWSAHLMAMVNAALSLLAVDLIARRYLPREKRLIALLLLMLTPFYHFQAVRFGANQVLLLTWPLAVYCFLRAFESRSLLWGAAAGAAAALAMLGKYFSIYLVGALIVAALLHPDRWRYLRSPSPWASIVAGLAVLAPHFLWLHETGFQTFSYAVAVHGASRLGALLSTPSYLTGGLAYVLLPLLVFGLAVRPHPADVLRALWPREPDQQLVASLMWSMLLLPAVSAPFIGVEITSLWTMQSWFLLPILLLMPERIQVDRKAATAIAATVLVVTVIVLLIAPALAWSKHRQGTRESRAYYAPAAEELTRRWREVSGPPLTIVLGDSEFVLAATFYAPDHPDSVPGFQFAAVPWVTPERMAREGFAAICRDEGCAARALDLAAGRSGTRRVEIAAVRRFFGSSTAPARIILVLAPPKATQ